LGNEVPLEERKRAALPLLRSTDGLGSAFLRPPLITDRTVPRLAEGAELLGQYRGSGLRQAPWLIRAPDGHVVQVTPLLYALAAGIDGRRHIDTTAP
jgi:hypothetical protein